MDGGSAVNERCLHKGKLIAEARLRGEDCEIDAFFLLDKANVGLIIILFSTLQIFLRLGLVIAQHLHL